MHIYVSTQNQPAKIVTINVHCGRLRWNAKQTKHGCRKIVKVVVTNVKVLPITVKSLNFVYIVTKSWRLTDEGDFNFVINWIQYVPFRHRIKPAQELVTVYNASFF